MVSHSFREGPIERIVCDGSRHDPFCTVLLEQVSESVGVSRRAVCPHNQAARLTLLRQAPQDAGCVRETLPVMFISTESASHVARMEGSCQAGPNVESPPKA